MKNKLPEYNPNEVNEVLFIVSDLTDTDKTLPIQAKEPECFNKFFDELTALCAKHNMTIDSYGIRKLMSERIAKKEFELYKIDESRYKDAISLNCYLPDYYMYMIKHLKPKQ